MYRNRLDDRVRNGIKSDREKERERETYVE